MADRGALWKTLGPGLLMAGAAVGVSHLVQSTRAGAVYGFGLLGLNAPHGALLVGALAVLNALLGMALGLLVSAFARTEFQAVQFMPAFILPQLLLCGLFVPRDDMASLLDTVSYLMPLTYAYDALARVTSPAPLGSDFTIDVLAVIGITIAALALGAVTLRRRTP